MNIAIIGSGYVGLVTGVCMASIGHRVICVDNVEEKVQRLRKGIVPIYEPGLEEIMAEMMKKKRLSFTTSIQEATRQSTVIFIAVGTPSKKNGDADLTYVENVAKQIAENMDDYKLIVEKSTVPADTGNRIKRTIERSLPKRKGSKQPLTFDVASNPEFLREGSAIEDFMKPDRVVIGVESPKAEEILREVYEPLKTHMVVTNINSAEIIKHASNSFLATKISFANALSQICDRVGADILKVTEGMGLDGRIGRSFLNAGIGYGGSCFPKDVDAFIRLSERSGYDFRLLKEVRAVNEEQKLSFVRLMEDKLWILKDKVIGILGLAFKPDTDDMRNAPSLDIIAELQREGAQIRAYDPQAMDNAKKLLKDIVYCPDILSTAKGCDCLVLLTEWDVFKKMDFKKIGRQMKQRLLFDGRNLYDPVKMKNLGFEYYGVGRGARDAIKDS
jgi:UDPglucose 6-dehydrogenase